MELNSGSSTGVMLCTTSESLATALTEFLEGPAAQQTLGGTVSAYPLQVLAPDELASTPCDIENTVIVIAKDSDEENLRYLDLVIQRLPGAYVIVAMREFNPKVESLCMNHGAFDVTLLPGNSRADAQALFTRIQRVERIMLQLAQAKVAEHQEKVNAAVLDQALSLVPQAVVVLDSQGHVEYANRAMGRLTRTTSHSMLGAKIGSWISPTGCHGNPEATILLQAREQGDSSQISVTLTRTGGEVVEATISATQFTLDGQRKAVLVVTDATERPLDPVDLSSNIYNLHSFARNSRSDFIQWLDDVSEQVRDSDTKSLGVLTVRLCSNADLASNETHAFIEDLSDEAARVLSVMASDYGFGVWDEGHLAIGIVMEAPRGFNAILSRLEMILEEHPLAEETAICLEGEVGIQSPEGAAVMARIMASSSPEDDLTAGVHTNIR